MGATVWDPHLEKDKIILERVQRQAARFIKNDNRLTSSVTKMLGEFGLQSTEERRKDLPLTLLHKITHGYVDIHNKTLGIDKHEIKIRASHCLKYKQRAATTNELKLSFMNRIIQEWNKLPSETVARFKTIMASLTSAWYTLWWFVADYQSRSRRGLFLILKKKCIIVGPRYYKQHPLQILTFLTTVLVLIRFLPIYFLFQLLLPKFSHQLVCFTDNLLSFVLIIFHVYKYQQWTSQ